ncbi:AMP-binding protein [Embleya scabrispora]|uniref:AMP-binding protein n=1 Tax=Embleya scabrispora TaxID=159449 RepID=UPI0003724A3A|nr:AMP-binding protein [Embleya scabrispora]
MSDSVINHIVARAPSPGHHIRFFRLGGIETVELTDFHARAGRLALWLRELGIDRGDRIGILAANSLEWMLLDVAAIRLGAVSVGFDPAKFDTDTGLSERYRLSVLFTDRTPTAPGSRALGEVGPAAARARPGQVLEPLVYAPDDVLSLKLTSGSTGEPKTLTAGVGSVDDDLRAVQEMFAHGADDNLLVFLPLSVVQQRYWTYSALRWGHDVTICTYESAFPALRLVRPTVVMGVPGFFESARRHIQARMGDTAGGDADGVRRNAARQLFGDRIRYLWTGSAPAAAGTLRFFTDAGLPIFEGYGLNETCIVAKNHPGAHRQGSVGRVLPGKQVLLDAEGVIHVRAEHPVCRGYEQAPPGVSQSVFAADGTVRTNDIGRLDEDGFLYIHGRADDVIVLDNGRKIAVRPLEEHMKISPAIEECVVFCPTQTHLVAVVSPAVEPIGPAEERAIAEQLALTNAAFGVDEQIRDVVVAHPRFGVENGLLTSQLKPRRERILDTYRSRIHDNQGSIHAVRD